jgi:hypothetical protein
VGALLGHPAVQAGVAPFAVALAAAWLLRRFQLAGLAAIAALATAAWLMNGPAYEPLTITRKMILVWLGAAALGFLADALARPGVALLALCAAAAALASVWTFQAVLAQKPALEAALAAGAIALYAALLVSALGALGREPLRAGGAALGLGLGAGFAAILGGSTAHGLYGLALASGAAAFLLVQSASRGTKAAGALFTLPAALAAALPAAGAVLLASLGWHVAALLVLVPLAARLPLPGRRPLWLQAIVVSLYGIGAGAAGWVVAWQHAGRP